MLSQPVCRPCLVHAGRGARIDGANGSDEQAWRHQYADEVTTEDISSMVVSTSFLSVALARCQNRLRQNLREQYSYCSFKTGQTHEKFVKRWQAVPEAGLGWVPLGTVYVFVLQKNQCGATHLCSPILFNLKCAGLVPCVPKQLDFPTLLGNCSPPAWHASALIKGIY